MKTGCQKTEAKERSGRTQKPVAQSSREAETQHAWSRRRQEKLGCALTDARRSSPRRQNPHRPLSLPPVKQIVISRIILQSKKMFAFQARLGNAVDSPACTWS